MRRWPLRLREAKPKRQKGTFDRASIFYQERVSVNDGCVCSVALVSLAFVACWLNCCCHCYE